MPTLPPEGLMAKFSHEVHAAPVPRPCPPMVGTSKEVPNTTCFPLSPFGPKAPATQGPAGVPVP
eukprot:27746-Pelagococcus_subviridis.AAC.1